MPINAIKVVPPAPEGGRRKPQGPTFGTLLNCNYQLNKDTFQYSVKKK